MSRYIDADALMQDINNSIDGMTTVGFTVDAEYLWGKLHDALEHAPSIDIVRCRECKHCHYEQENDVYHCYKLFHRFYDANKHFCSYGEREVER